MYQADCQKCNACISSDASGSWGCGAFSGDKWFQIKWPLTLQASHITVKELVPIILAVAVWGCEWAGQNIMALCDNMAVVDVLRKGDSKEPQVMHLLRCLAFLKAHFQFSLFASHICGRSNDLADALSRNNSQYFLAHYPQARRNPTPLPPELLDLTIVQMPDWTSRLWTVLWNDIFRQDYSAVHTAIVRFREAEILKFL